MFDPRDQPFDRTMLLEAARLAPLIAVLSLVAGGVSALGVTTSLGVWPLWLPSAVATFAVLRWGKAALPGVWLGSFTTFWILSPWNGQGAGVALALACTATLHAATLDWLATRWPISLREKHDALRFVAFVGLIPTLFPSLLNGLLFDLLDIVPSNQVALAMFRCGASETCAALLGATVAAYLHSPLSLRNVTLPPSGVTLVACLLVARDTSWLAAMFPLLIVATSAACLLLLNRPEVEASITATPEVRVVRDEVEIQRLALLLQQRTLAHQTIEQSRTTREGELQRTIADQRRLAADALARQDTEHESKLADLRRQLDDAMRGAAEARKRQHDGEQRMIEYQQLENEWRQREASLRQQVQASLDRVAEAQRRERESLTQRDALAKDLADWQQRARDTEQQLRELQAHRGDAEQRHDELLQAERQLRGQLQERQATISRLEAELRQRHESHSAEKTRIEHALAESQQEQQRRQAEFARLEAELRQQRERHAEQGSRFERTLAETHHEKMQAAERVAGQVARDFANPLCAMLGTIDLLGQQWDLPDDFRQALQRVREAGTAATAKLASLQALGGAATASSQRLDLRDLATSARASKPGVRVECDAETSAWVEGNADDLRRLVQHLVANAAEATPAGGVVRVSADVDGERAFLRVEDHGAGMDDATRRRCTEPFFTAKSGGHRGFGLAECWAIAQRHGGRLDIDSAPGKGTRVTLWLASRAEEAAKPRKRSA